MHPFPLIEALWASLDQERPSGDDPVRVASALHRFYADFLQGFRQGRRNRWKTELFKRSSTKLEEDLNAVLQLCAQLSASLAAGGGADEFSKRLRDLDLAIREALWELEQEERGFALPPLPSPQLMQLNYLYEGWARSLLPVEPLQSFLGEFAGSLEQARQEVKKAGQTVSERESEQETKAVESASQSLDGLAQAITKLLSTLPNGAASCAPIRDQIVTLGGKLSQAFSELEQCAPLAEPCPFCNGELSLSGRCRTCGRRLPHLEDDLPPGEEQPLESTFRANNLRAVDMAVLQFESDPTSEPLWKALQAAVRRFGDQVSEGRKRVGMLATSADRPVASDSPERLREVELEKIGEAFLEAQKVLSKFAFQSFPPDGALPRDWRETLYVAEARLQQLESKLGS